MARGRVVLIGTVIVAVAAALWTVIGREPESAAPPNAVATGRVRTEKRPTRRSTDKDSSLVTTRRPRVRPRFAEPVEPVGDNAPPKIESHSFERLLKSVLDSLDIDEPFELRCDDGPCVAVFRPTRRDLVVGLSTFRRNLEQAYEEEGLDVVVHTLEKLASNGGRYIVVMPEVGGDPTDLRNLPERLEEVLEELEEQGPPPEPEEPMPEGANPFAPDREPPPEAP